ncbi:uncharacterized protein [Nicotiana tomentosiformis]|uniref:uncharacterized protein n=1 Tax=Nicotiana tomentosiformis TaxID=4098 RepID=UPI00388C3B9A
MQLFLGCLKRYLTSKIGFRSLTKDAILRPSSGEKETKSPVLKPGEDKKRKTSSQSEEPKPKLGSKPESRRRVKCLGTDGPAIELQKVSEERNALKLLCGQKDKTIKDLQADLAKAHKEEAELDKQVRILLIKYGLDPTVEANTSLSQLQQKVERIELLRGEVDQVKADCDRWKENMDRLAAEKETTLAKLLSVKVQLRGIKEKSFAQAKRIEELQTRLAEAKSEIDKTKVMADKSIAMYWADTEAAQI